MGRLRAQMAGSGSGRLKRAQRILAQPPENTSIPLADLGRYSAVVTTPLAENQMLLRAGHPKLSAAPTASHALADFGLHH